MRRLALVIAGVTLFAATACGDGPGPGDNVTGTYTLQTINGDPVPVTVDETAEYRLDITAGSFAVNTNASFSNTLTYRLTQGTETLTGTVTCSGTYTRTGATLNFNQVETDECFDDNYTGTVSGSNLTIVYDSEFEVVYRR